MAVTIEQIETKEFKKVQRGYDPEEVDTFLDDIIDEMDRMDQEIHSLQQQLAAAKSAQPAPAVKAAAKPAATIGSKKYKTLEAVKPSELKAAPAPVKAGDDSGSRKALELIEMAQKLKDAAIEKAQAEADDIVAKAKALSEEQIGSLSTQKAALEEQIGSLKQVASDYRAKFESLLAAQQEALEKATDLF